MLFEHTQQGLRRCAVIATKPDRRQEVKPVSVCHWNDDGLSQVEQGANSHCVSLQVGKTVGFKFTPRIAHSLIYCQNTSQFNDFDTRW